MAEMAPGSVPVEVLISMTEASAKAMALSGVHEAEVSRKLDTVLQNQGEIAKNQDLAEARWLVFTKVPTLSAFVLGIALGFAIAAFGVPALMRAGLNPSELIPTQVGAQ